MDIEGVALRETKDWLALAQLYSGPGAELLTELSVTSHSALLLSRPAMPPRWTRCARHVAAPPLVGDHIPWRKPWVSKPWRDAYSLRAWPLRSERQDSRSAAAEGSAEDSIASEELARVLKGALAQISGGATAEAHVSIVGAKE